MAEDKEGQKDLLDTATELTEHKDKERTVLEALSFYASALQALKMFPGCRIFVVDPKTGEVKAMFGLGGKGCCGSGDCGDCKNDSGRKPDDEPGCGGGG